MHHDNPRSPAPLPRRAVFLTAELRAAGLTSRTIRAAVDGGSLIRVRRGRYARGDAPPAIIAAARTGGRLDCVSMLRLLGVFVLDESRPHVRVNAHAGRFDKRGLVIHWRVPEDDISGQDMVSIRDAAAQAVLCQEARAAVATLDSLLHLKLLSEDDLDAMFRALPARTQVLRRLVDGRAESGGETLLRLILRTLPVDVRTQVTIARVGRVDFLVDGWLIIECDGREFHQGWDKQQVDRRRDVEAAAQGYVTVRFIAADVFGDSSSVRTQIARVLDALTPRFRRARVRNSG